MTKWSFLGMNWQILGLSGRGPPVWVFCGGFIPHATLHVVVGRGRAVTSAAWGLAAVSVALLVIKHVH